MSQVINTYKNTPLTAQTSPFPGYPMVMRLAYECEFYELVTWLDENKKLYSEGIFRGFAVEEEPISD